jgi:hypothetical protein
MLILLCVNFLFAKWEVQGKGREDIFKILDFFFFY